jgi:hypothetical protein
VCIKRSSTGKPEGLFIGLREILEDFAAPEEIEIFVFCLSFLCTDLSFFRVIPGYFCNVFMSALSSFLGSISERSKAKRICSNPSTTGVETTRSKV